MFKLICSGWRGVQKASACRVVCGCALALAASAFAAADMSQAQTKERDLFADTWDAMDALGRKLGDASTLPAPRKKQVGIFYWTWHRTDASSTAISNDVRIQFAEAQAGDL